MEYRKTLRRESYFAEDIDKISNYKIWEKLTVRKLELSSKAIQKAYKEMKEWKFEGDIIDYLCYVCLEECIINVVEAYRATNSIKKSLDFFETFLLVEKSQRVLIPTCRLLLKNESYLATAFGMFSTITPKDELYIETRKVLIKKMNSLLEYKP